MHPANAALPSPLSSGGRASWRLSWTKLTNATHKRRDLRVPQTLSGARPAGLQNGAPDSPGRWGHRLCPPLLLRWLIAPKASRFSPAPLKTLNSLSAGPYRRTRIGE